MSTFLIRPSEIDRMLMEQVPAKDPNKQGSGFSLTDFGTSSKLCSQELANESGISSTISVTHKDDSERFDYHSEEVKSDLQQCGILLCGPDLSASLEDQSSGPVTVFSSPNRTDDRPEAECEIQNNPYGSMKTNESSVLNSDVNVVALTPVNSLSEKATVENYDHNTSPQIPCVVMDGWCPNRSPESPGYVSNREQDVDVNRKVSPQAPHEVDGHLVTVTKESCLVSETDVSRDSISQEKLSPSCKISDAKDLASSDVMCKKQSPKVPRSASPPQVHRCQLCGKHYRHVASLRNHMRKHQSGALPLKRYKCHYCVYSSQYNRNVLKHIEAVHQNSDSFFPMSAPIPSNSPYIDRGIVNGMNPAYWSPASSNEHLYKTQGGAGAVYNITNQCFYRQQTSGDSNGNFETADVLQSIDTSAVDTYQQAPAERMAIEQTTNSPYYCSVVGCGKPFKTMKCLTAHMNDCHCEVHFKCPVKGCNFSGQRQEHLKRHMNQHHTERKNSLQELLTNAATHMSEPQPGTINPGFYATNSLRSQLTNPMHKRHATDIPFQNDTMTTAPQHDAPGYLPQNCQEPARRIGVDVYSFPGSAVNQANNFASRMQQGCMNESSTDRGFDDPCQSRLQSESARPNNSLRTGTTTHPIVSCTGPRVPSACVPRLEVPGSCKAFESSFDPRNSYDGSFNQTFHARSADTSSNMVTAPHYRKPVAGKCDSIVRSTVEQLLCAPDNADGSLEQLFHKPSANSLTISDEFAARGSPLEDLIGDITRESNSVTRENEITSVEFDSPRNPQDLNDNLSDAIYQKHVNSETDAFFSDLQEILARDMPSLDNSTPKAVEWQNVDPGSVGLKEDGQTSGELTTSKSPFIGLGAKPVCTASLMSGDSGVESWSSSSSCSAGPNGSSVWGPQENMCNLKSSPSATTPQPASIPGPGLQEMNMTHFEGYVDGQAYSESSTSLAPNSELRVSQDLYRQPSRNYGSVPQGNSENQSSFVMNTIQQGMVGDQSILPPMISAADQGLRTTVGERNSNSSQSMEIGSTHQQTISADQVSHIQTDVAFNPNRTVGHPLSSTVDPSPQYRRGDPMDIADSRVHSYMTQMDTSSVLQTTAPYGHTQAPSHPNLNRYYLQQQQQQQQLPTQQNYQHHHHNHAHLQQNGSTFMEMSAPGFEANTTGTTRPSRQNCTKPDRAALEQQQQQCYRKASPCLPFEPSGYRSVGYVRSTGSSVVLPTVQTGPESPYMQSHNVPGCVNPAQPPNIERRHGFVACDVNRMDSDGSAFMPPASTEQIGEVEMKSAAHGTSFATGRANSYSYSDASGVVRTDPHPMSNTRHAWSGNYPTVAYPAYQAAQQQQQQQQQQSYKVYYGGSVGPYDPMSTASTMPYPIEQYGTHPAYSRQSNAPPCEAQLFTYHHQEHPQQQQQQQQQPQHQSQPINNPASVASYPNYNAPPTTAQTIDSSSSTNYHQHTQRIPQHIGSRLPQANPLQHQPHGMQVHSRNLVQQQQQQQQPPPPPQHMGPYSTMDRQALNRVPEIANTADLYPNTAGADLNPVWPAAAESCSMYLPDSAPMRNGSKGAGGVGSLPAPVRRPSGSGTVCISSYPVSDPAQVAHPSVETNSTWIPSVSMSNTDSSFGVRSMSATTSPSTLSGHPLHQGMNRSVNGQTVDTFDGCVSAACPTVVNR